ncbi:DNA polymerase III subunit alpha [Verrucomicrobiota bacterium]
MYSYVPIRVRSNFSLLSGASSIDALVEKASLFGMPALALTDTNNLYGAVYFFDKARRYGVRPIIGAIVNCGQGEVVLLAQNSNGYANLCEIISRRNLDGNFSLTDTVAERQEGLFVLTADPALLESLREKVDRKRLMLEIIRPVENRARTKAAIATAKRLNVGIVASCDAYFAAPSDFYLHRILCAMRCNTPAWKLDEKLFAPQNAHLRTPKEMSWLFKELPRALKATHRVREECSFSFHDLPTTFPKVPGSSPMMLRARTLEGAQARYRKLTPEIIARIKHECRLIISLGFADYFLVVADIVNHARSLGTPVAGRGSGASSIVAYSLGITNVDPIRHKLPFARFLNRNRRDFPDLDIDFCWRLRDDIIDYVYRTYGHKHVAMIATYATLQPQLAFRETAKALGIPASAVAGMMKKLHINLPRDEWAEPAGQSRMVDQAMRFAQKLIGFPHHLSVHCGGLVITPGKMARRTPLQRAAKGVVITQYDKEAVESVGLVKLDLLGNRALSAMGEAIHLVNKTKGITIDPERMPETDPKIPRLLAASNTVGVCQLESPAMRNLLRQIQPSSMETLMQVLALIRPGAASLGMKGAFVRRARGMEPIPKIDPRLDDILRETYGIMLYEDDALFVAAALAGLPTEKADRFRRAVTKCRSNERRLQLSRSFLGLCRKNGVDPDIAADLWSQMAKFNSYSFCRAHAASYARLAWTNAYIKSHHPAEFWVAVLNNNNGMYDKWVYIEEAKRCGLPILLPCVNRSAEDFTLENGAIRIGLGQVRMLCTATKHSIYKQRPFDGLADLVMRTSLKIGEGENLVRVGALDFIDRPRSELLKELHLCFKSAKTLRGTAVLIRPPDPVPRSIEVPAVSEAERLSDEWDLLGFSSGRHPVAYIRTSLEKRNILRSSSIPERIGEQIRLCGIAAAARTTPSKNGKRMCFLTLSDEDGLFEITMFPAIYERYKAMFARCGMGLFCVSGKVESQYNAISITADQIATTNFG